MSSPLILDVSNNRTIDELALRRANVAGLYCKATEGTGFVDGTYAQHRAVAKAAGVPFGAYLFLHPQSEGSQASFFLEHARPRKGDLQPVIDCEVTDGQPLAVVAKRAAACASILQAAGFRPLLYSSASFLQQLYACQPRLRILRTWEAQYPGRLTGWSASYARLRYRLGHGASVALWQFTDSYRVPGAASGYDCSRLLVPLRTLLV